MGEWLPQALQARRQTLREVLARLERQQARLLDLGSLGFPVASIVLNINTLVRMIHF
jgi:hypothetical protein